MTDYISHELIGQVLALPTRLMWTEYDDELVGITVLNTLEKNAS